MDIRYWGLGFDVLVRDLSPKGGIMKREHCCEELAGNLGKGNDYPKPAYISPQDWENKGHLDWWYPGADGPGYYEIYLLSETQDLSTPIGMITVPKIEYRRMVICPYCGDEKDRATCPECGADIPADGCCWYCENAPGNESRDFEEVDLGICCACEGSENVRNIICLDRRGPTPGKGWGCFICGLPGDGAVAVLCDECLEGEAAIRFVCVGYPASDGRMPIEELSDEPFEHDLACHRELDGNRVCQGDPN